MLSSSLLSLSLLTVAATLPPMFGPPTLCVPLDIGTAKSLPFGEGAFERHPDYRIEGLRGDTLTILAASNDAEVHFETLRRASVYLMSEGKAERKKRQSAASIAAALHRGLRSRALDVLSDPSSTQQQQSLAWFDLGLFELDMKILGMPQQGRTWRYLEQAGRLQSDDPTMSTLLFAAGFSQRKSGWWKPHLSRALARREQMQPRTRRNLLTLTGRFLQAKDMESLLRDYGPKAAKK